MRKQQGVHVEAADKLPQQHTSQFRGLDIIIEWPKGSIRVGENPDGKKWKREMKADYGYVRDANTVNDHEELDVYLGTNPEAEYAYVIEQLDDNGELDEYKVMLGFDSLEEAKQMYLSHYPKDWEDTHLGEIAEVPFEYLFDTIEEHKEENEPVIASGEHISLEELKAAAERAPKCPHCGSSDYGLMPSDFETAKCNSCGKNWEHGIVEGINDPKTAGKDGWTGAETGLRCQPDYMEPGSYCAEINKLNENDKKASDKTAAAATFPLNQIEFRLWEDDYEQRYTERTTRTHQKEDRWYGGQDGWNTSRAQGKAVAEDPTGHVVAVLDYTDNLFTRTVDVHKADVEPEYSQQGLLSALVRLLREEKPGNYVNMSSYTHDLVSRDMPEKMKNRKKTVKSSENDTETGKTAATENKTSSAWSVFAKVQRGFSTGKIARTLGRRA